MDNKKILSVLRNIVFTGVNMMLGVLVAVIMAGSGFFRLLLDMRHHAPLQGFDLFFDTYIIDPITGGVYFAATIAFVIYQGRISALHRLYLNIGVFILSAGILYKVVTLF